MKLQTQIKESYEAHEGLGTTGVLEVVEGFMAHVRDDNQNGQKSNTPLAAQ